MKTRTEQAGTVAKQEPGMSSHTANNVLQRTVINSPANENQIRGICIIPHMVFNNVREMLVLAGKEYEFDTCLAEGLIQEGA